MTRFTNEAKGARGIVKNDSSYVFIDPGETVDIPSHEVRWVPDGVTVSKPDPLDHDRDGRPGGSVAPDDPQEALRAMRAEYQIVMKKRPFPGWDIAELERRMANA